MFRPDEKSRDYSRAGWAKYSSEEHCEGALKKLHKWPVGNYNLRLFPATNPVDLEVPKFTLESENVESDLKLSIEVLRIV
eukprot:636281-Amorphochlora_amoeboformis.AAC.1